MAKEKIDEIDKIDREILRRLQIDGRLSCRAIAKELNLSAVTVSIRIRNLVSRGIIRKFTAIVDPTKIGKKYPFLVYFRVRPGIKLNRIAEEIEKIDNSCCIHFVTGEYDLHLLVRTTDNHEAAEMLEKLRMIKGVERVDSVSILRSYKPYYEVVL